MPLTDRTGAPVAIEVRRDGTVSSYAATVDDGVVAGRAEFLDGGSERIFFHTEVDAAYGGRGLAGLLVARALEESIRDHVTVVPICPVFARHLRDHGAEFAAVGGVVRRPSPADGEAVEEALRRRRG